MTVVCRFVDFEVIFEGGLRVGYAVLFRPENRFSLLPGCLGPWYGEAGLLVVVPVSLVEFYV